MFCILYSDAENEEDDDDDDDADKNVNNEDMDTSEAAETRPQNPDDEYNFADYDNEGTMREQKSFVWQTDIFRTLYSFD